MNVSRLASLRGLASAFRCFCDGNADAVLHLWDMTHTFVKI